MLLVAARRRLLRVREAPGRPASHGEARLPAAAAPDSSLPLPPQVLPCLLRPFSHVLYHLPLGTVTSLVQQLTNLPQSAPAPAPANLHLTAVLQNKVRPSPSLRQIPVFGKPKFPSSLLVPDGRAWMRPRCRNGTGLPQAASPWHSPLLLLINEGVWQIN